MQRAIQKKLLSKWNFNLVRSENVVAAASLSSMQAASESAVSPKWCFVGEKLREAHESGTWKSELVIQGKQAPTIKVEGHAGEMLNFCANNYLGLSSHPLVVEAALDAVRSHGNGYSSVRFICGTSDLHKELETKVAAFHGREDAILYASCFDANAGLFESLLSAGDAVISDELNHASIIDGVRLCKAQRFRYGHSDMQQLREALAAASDCRTKLIVTDGVFSMDGDIALLPSIRQLAAEYQAITVIDDCHATGFLGETGRGTEQHWGMALGEIDIVNSTLGKALGGAAGGYTTGPKCVIDLLRQRARPYLFSNALPPAVVGSAIKVFDLLSDSSDWPQQLQRNTKQFRELMTEAGFTVAGDASCPICPVMLQQEQLAKQFAERMQAAGIFVVSFSYPVVPSGKARIRVQLSAAHTQQQIDTAVHHFVRVGRELGVIQ